MVHSCRCTIYTHRDLKYKLVDKEKKEHTCVSTSCAKLPNANPNHI